MLSRPEERAGLLTGYGADAVLILPFTKEVSGWSPEEFIDRVLVGALHAKAVVVGENFRFGHKAAGHVDTLVAAGAKDGFQVEGLSLSGDGQPWSSTYIRERIAEGDVEAAAEALGRPLRVTGVVVEGDKRGRELGYPTANIPADATAAIPLDGVYAGWLLRPSLGESEQRVLPAAVSIGTNPTFDGTSRRVEAYVLDRTDLDLYGERVVLELVQRLRPTLRFESVDRLVEQMRLDVQECREVLGHGVVPRSYGPTYPVHPQAAQHVDGPPPAD